MNNYKFTDHKGSFYLKNPENTSYLYFPIVGDQGIKGALTPNLGGDSKVGQMQFILQPVSVEDLHNNKSTRNFWCHIKEKGIWSATGVSAIEESYKFTKKKEESYLEAGILWHRIGRSSSLYGLQSEITSFVPISHAKVEVMQVKIKNISSKPITLTPTAAIPLYGRSADNIRDHRHVTSLLHQIKTRDYGVVVTPTLTFDERGHQENSSTYFVSGVSSDGKKPIGFYPIVENYIGEGGSFDWPEAIVKNLPAEKACQRFDGYEAVGGLQFTEITLLPQEEKSYTILIGMVDENDFNSTKRPNSFKEVDNYIKNITRQFASENKVKAQLEKVKEYWEEKCNVTYETADSNFDNFMYWVNFQPTLRRLYGCSFLPHHDYGKGGRGWRDLWQDLLALIIMNPESVKELLISNFAGIRIDGTNATIIGNKPGEFIADRNNITRVWMDHGVWPCMTTKLYIDQTGDCQVLLEENTYFKDQQIIRGSNKEEWDQDKPYILCDQKGRPYSGTILEHLLLQNLTAFYEVGEHNHIRLRGADWNDALDMAPNRGESVAFTAAYASNLEDLAQLIHLLNEQSNINNIRIAKEMEILLIDDPSLYEDINRKNQLLMDYCKSCSSNISGKKVSVSSNKVIQSLRNKANWIKNHIHHKEWIPGIEEEGWFNGYYDDNGNRVEGIFDEKSKELEIESKRNIRMMLTSQVFTIMSGTASDKQTKQIINSADKYLYDKKVGGYRLNTNFHEVKMDLGRMFGFAYGHKENGAVFSHMTVMYANALYKRGFVKEAFKVINTLYLHGMNFKISKIYPGIPEYFNEDGRGMYHYLTGSASWLMLTVITQMFGVKGQNGDLLIEPKLVKEQFNDKGKVALNIKFHNKKFHIIFTNENALDYGQYKISSLHLNGIKYQANSQKAQIPLEEIKKLSGNKTHSIIIVLG